MVILSVFLKPKEKLPIKWVKIFSVFKKYPSSLQISRFDITPTAL